MAHGLAIVIGDDWEAQLQFHCIYANDGTERPGHFDSYELGGRFGNPLKLRGARPRSGLMRLLGPKTHATQARRSEVDITRLEEHFSFAVIVGTEWKEPSTFEEAQRLIAAVPGDPQLTAVDYHL
jgi:hypothetical protein